MSSIGTTPVLRAEPSRILEQSLGFDYLSGGSHTRPSPFGLQEEHTTFYTLAGQVTRGSLRLRVGDAPFREFQAGDCYVIPPGNRLTYESRKPGTLRVNWSHWNFHVLGIIDLFSLLSVPSLHAPSDGHQMGDLIGRALKVFAPTHDGDLLRLMQRRTLGFELLALILEQAQPASGGTSFPQQISRLHPVATYIAANLQKPIRRAELARLACLSEPQFHVVFTNTFHMSPLAYVKSLRLRKAQQLLLRADRSIAEVGAEVGYADPFHFSRAFKAFCSLTPMAYRQRGRKWLHASCD